MDLAIGPAGWEVDPGAMSESVTSAFAWILFAWAAGAVLFLLLIAFLCAPAVRRRFWCVAARRPVDVDFEEGGLPWRRRPLKVVSCSAFDPPTEVTCKCTCLECTGRLPLDEAPKAEESPSHRPA